LAAPGKKGKTEREARGIDSRPHLARRRPKGAGPRRPAAAGRGVYGGGAARPGRELAVASGVVVAEGCVEPLFIGGVTQGEGRHRWPAVGKLCGAFNGVGAVRWH
jgi:hypothetical protein